MSRRERLANTDTSDALMGFLDTAARFMLWASLLALAASLGFLLYTYMVFAGGAAAQGASVAQANANVDMLSKVLFASIFALAVATSFLWWGEETLAPLQLIGALALFFSPMYLPSMLGGGQAPQIESAVLKSVQTAGAIAGIVAIFCAVGDVAGRIKTRARQGSKADQLKYGKGVKEERDVQNVFMGKCWQLPFCRKFVRERCPIYHARRTCWKERVGCMCEEEVIRNAMEGRVIPKDMVAAAKFIPRNAKLTQDQKAERCRQCVIYNEHQKHKYKLALPVVVGGVGLAYILGRTQLLDGLAVLLDRANRVVASATYQKPGSLAQESTGFTVFKELLLVCFMLIIIAYLMKLIEYLFFKLKV